MIIIKIEPNYHPDFDNECQICGTLPTVFVEGHRQPQTELCGFHFFNLPEMKDYEKWNDSRDSE